MLSVLPTLAPWLLFLVLPPPTKAPRQDSGTPAATVVAPDGKEYPLFPTALEDALELPSPFLSKDGREILLGRSAEGTSYLLDLGLVEDTVVENGQRRIIAPGRQQTVGCADFPSLQETGLHEDSTLDALTAITGRSLADLQRDAQPNQLSTAGFLVPGEDLRTLLKADNATVRALGLTHPQLARPLFHLWNLNLLAMNQPRIPSREQRINTLIYHQNEVTVQTGSTRGFQVSLFQDEVVGNGELQVARELTDADRAFLQEVYPDLSEAIRETLEKRLTRIHTGEMVAFYIQRYGFYEGHTDYRADPLALAWIFGLKTLPQIDKALPGGLPRLLVEDWPD